MSSLVETTNAECAARLSSFLAEGGEIAYFIGSGLTRAFYPTWTGLALRMHAYFHEQGFDLAGDFPTGDELDRYLPQELQDVFQRFRDADPQLYVACIQNTFEQRPLNHNACILKIVRTLPPLIVTLNYDIAIECAAEDCGIKVARRFFPGRRNLNQTHATRPVVMHLHGTYYPGLVNDPDEIILHSSSYRRYYEERHREILAVYADIFSRWNVVFVATGLTEPEMTFFFKALHAYQADADCEKHKIALVHTAAANEPTESMAEFTLRAERSKDVTEQEETGIERIRFFKKDEEHRGLNEVLSTAFGQNIAAPQVETIW